VAEALSIKVNLRDTAKRMTEAANCAGCMDLSPANMSWTHFPAWAEKSHKKLIVPLAYSEAK